MSTVSVRLSDFPFYADGSTGVSPRGWVLLMMSLLVAVDALFVTSPASPLAAVLFAGIPLAMLAALSGRHWTALFRPVGAREIGIMVVTAVVTMLASAAAALIVRTHAATVANPVIAAMGSMTVIGYVTRLASTLPQLLGEELLAILPFLAILWFATQRLRIQQTAAILAALIGSTAVFAAAHLSTYDWHLAQCFGVIGTARIVLTLSYVWTRNLWVPLGAHVLNDWTELTLVFGFGHAPVGAG